ncbi:hypothetical protein AYI68_g2378 [Smittium mucronatum]|uniref:Ras-binding domain-containing protein n=1 Tax=Smittium mucronatum TaxID=133383 RepID=A0A1R0H323_9FUNG|nr:hypothetical protein AYI68_g2378 [Smittium mucronatum]
MTIETVPNPRIIDISSFYSPKSSPNESPTDSIVDSAKLPETTTRLDSKNAFSTDLNSKTGSSFKSSDNRYPTDQISQNQFSTPNRKLLDKGIQEISLSRAMDLDSNKSGSSGSSSRHELIGQGIDSMKSISVIGPHGETKFVGIEASESGKDILYSALNSFGLMGDKDKDKYAIFHVSGEQGGARMLSHSQLYKICTQNNLPKTEKFFLKKRHQLTIVPPSAQRDAELQRAIEKLETALLPPPPPPPGSSSPYKQTNPYSPQSKSLYSPNSSSIYNSKKASYSSRQQYSNPKMSPFMFNQDSTRISIKGVGSIEKIHSFFGQRPPSEQVHNNLAKFFPGNEAKARNSIMRRNLNNSKKSFSPRNYQDSNFNGNSTYHSKNKTKEYKSRTISEKIQNKPYYTFNENPITNSYIKKTSENYEEYSLDDSSTSSLSNSEDLVENPNPPASTTHHNILPPIPTDSDFEIPQLKMTGKSKYKSLNPYILKYLLV